MLDYWVTTGVVAPSRKVVTERRSFFFFDYETIVQVRMVAGLRQNGLPLQKVRRAVNEVRKDRRNLAWLVTDGSKLYQLTNDPTVVEAISKKERGQLAFSFVAVGEIREKVLHALKKAEHVDFGRFQKLKRIE
jgi:DNA-binding transcriptional MerR regulator